MDSPEGRRVKFVPSHHNDYYSPDPTPPSSTPSTPRWTPSPLSQPDMTSAVIHGDYPATPHWRSVSLPDVELDGSEDGQNLSPASVQHVPLTPQPQTPRVSSSAVRLCLALAYNPAHGPLLLCDVTQRPSMAIVAPEHAMSQTLEDWLALPATDPPVTRMTLTCKLLPFTILVAPSSTAAAYASGPESSITVADVLQAIYTSLMEPTTDYEIMRARGGDVSGSPTQFFFPASGYAGMVRRRSDIVYGNSMFLGMTSTGLEGEWLLILGANRSDGLQ
ncbi:hypothetical protein PUNSTDRAFT_134617 [Punctularia strigosozonata HHB-11173 SS5]|uniref:uncharacterized protein n=1 Tax=Punctularia strigosozonata (strain HHB-11173) TaxID=741275 RepID=UPI0004416285|nr:uncharacterized protein PUNSTDRAFT_134617 [Punctularia strigosozonata HHB-11173 SS5]EIN08228.1 hypothetical protein PUNSTDRAFT_134617 [Punctularia strigosozonata HHB-11173 SS5]